MPETDGQLYIRFLKSFDEEAFKVLFEKYKDSLMLFIYEIVRNPDDAEELMMDTFAVLSSGTVRYKEKENAGFKTWLYAIAKNQARMFLRKNRVKFVPFDENAEHGSASTIIRMNPAGNLSQHGRTDIQDTSDYSSHPEQYIITNETNEQLYCAMETLPPDYRQALYLMYFEDMKPAQISRIMKKTTKQVYNLVSRGKKALKEALERMEP